MAAFIAPLLGGIPQAIEGLIKAHKLNEWAKLVFEIAFSGSGAFLFTCGSALTLHRPFLEAVGEGMVSAAVCGTVVFRRSPLTKGLMFALPAEEATKEMDTDIQVGQK